MIWYIFSSVLNHDSNALAPRVNRELGGLGISKTDSHAGCKKLSLAASAGFDVFSIWHAGPPLDRQRFFFFSFLTEESEFLPVEVNTMIMFNYLQNSQKCEANLPGSKWKAFQKESFLDIYIYIFAF